MDAQQESLLAPLRPQGQLLDEKGALDLWNRRNSIPEDERAWASQQYAAYLNDRKASGQKAWPSIEAAKNKQRDLLESRYLDGGAIPGDTQDQKDRYLDIAGIAHISGKTGSEVAMNESAYRAAVAHNLGSPGSEGKPEEFRSVIKNELQKRRDRRYLIEGNPNNKNDASSLQATAWKAGENYGEVNDNLVKSYEKWAKESIDKPGFTPDGKNSNFAIYSSLHGQAVKKWADFRSRARTISDHLATEMKKDTPVIDTESILGELSGLTRKERNVVLGLVTKDPSVESKHWIKKSGETIARVFTRIGYGASDIADRALNSIPSFREGDSYPASIADDPSALINKSVNNALGASGAGGGAGFIAPDISGPKVLLTKKQADAANIEIGRQGEQFKLMKELRDAATGTVDPVEGDNVFSDTLWYGSLNLAASVASFMMPGGMVLNYAAYYDDERNRLDSLGVSPKTAILQSIGVAAVQSSLDMVEVNLLKKLTNVRAFGESMKAPAVTMGQAFVERFPGALRTSALEGAVEGVQQVTPEVVQGFMNALGADEPGINIGELGKELWTTSVKTFFSMIPLAMFTAGIGSYKDYKGLKELVNQKDAMTALGFSEIQVEQISAQKTDREKAEYVKAIWSERTPLLTAAATPVQQQALNVMNNPDSTAADKMWAAKQSIGAEKQFIAHNAAMEALKQYAGVIGIKKEGKGFSATFTDGNPVHFATEGDVIDMLRVVTDEKTEKWYLAIGEQLGKMGKGRTFDLKAGKSKMYDDLLDAYESESTDRIELAWSRAHIAVADAGMGQIVQDMENPETKAILSKLRVLGRSVTEVKEKILQSTSILLEDGSIIDLVEENAENDIRESTLAGEVTVDIMRDRLLNVQNAIGIKLINGDNDQAVFEAWSKLVRLYCTGTRRDESMVLMDSENKTVAAVRSEMAQRIRQIRSALVAANANEQIDSTIVSALNENLDYLKEVLLNVKKVKKAQSEGKLADVETMIRQTIGLEDTSTDVKTLSENVVKNAEGFYGSSMSITSLTDIDNVINKIDEKMAGNIPARNEMHINALRSLLNLQYNLQNDRTTPSGKIIPKLSERRTKISLNREQQIRESFKSKLKSQSQLNAEQKAKEDSLYTKVPIESFSKQLPFRRAFALDRIIKSKGYESNDIYRKKESIEEEAYLRYVASKDLLVEDNGFSEEYAASLAGSATTGWVDRFINDVKIAKEEADAEVKKWFDESKAKEMANRERAKNEAQKFRDLEEKAQQDLGKQEQDAINKWRKEQNSIQRKDYSDLAQLSRDIRIMQAAFMAMPQEVRGAANSIYNVAILSSQPARARETLKQIGVLADMLEKNLRKDFSNQIKKIFKKSEANVGDGTVPKGKLTLNAQRSIDLAMSYAKMTLAEYNDALVKSFNAIAAAKTQEEKDRATSEWLNLDTFGAVLQGKKESRTAEEIYSAYKSLYNTYKDGKTGYQVKMESMKQKLNTWRESITNKLGKASQDDYDRRLQKDKSLLGMPNRALWETFKGTFNIHQQISDMIGESHPLYKELTVRIRRSRENVRIERFKESAALFEFIKKNLNLKSNADQVMMLGRLSKVVESPVVKMEGRESAVDEITPDLARKIVNGTAVNALYPAGSAAFKDLSDAVDKYEKELRDWSMKPQPMAGKAPILKYLEITRVTNEGTPRNIEMSQMEAIQYTLIYQQERYVSNMELHNLGASVQAEIENWLTPEAKVIREYIRGKYKEEYGPMNAVYKLLFNMDMPYEDNYARVAFNVYGNKNPIIGPDGLPMLGGGTTIPSIHGRMNHNAAPKKQNALVVRMSHVAEISHWKHTAELANDIRSIFTDNDVKYSIVTKHGNQVYQSFMVALRVLESGGWDDSLANNNGHEMINALMPTSIANALGANISSILAQGPASIVSMSKIGVFNYFKQIPNITPEILVKIYNDFSVQLRRGGQYSNGELLTMLTGRNSGIFAQAINRVGELGTESLALTDAYLTVMSGAVTYLHHLDSVKGTMGNAKMEEEFALDKMRETIEETAQPDDFSRKSNFENEISKSTGLRALALRQMFIFKGAARAASSNIFHTMLQWKEGEITGEVAAERMLALIVIIPVMEQALRSFAKDMASDEPDEKLYKDWRVWMYSMLAAPMTGIPGIGSIVDIGKVKAFGGFTVSVQDPITRLITDTSGSIGETIKFIRGNQGISVKAVEGAMHLTALGAAAYGLPGGPLLESAINIMKSASGASKGLKLTDDEKDVKYIKMLEKRAKAKEKKDKKENFEP